MNVDMKAVEELKKKQQKQHQKADTSQAAENANQAANNLAQFVAGARQSLKINMKNQIVGGAISDLLADFANGDFGDLSLELMTDFNVEFLGGIEADYKALEASVGEKKMLPGS